MTRGSNPVRARLSIIAELAGRPLDELYRLFRLEGAPRVAEHVGGVPVYDVELCMDWLHPTSAADVDSSAQQNLAPAGVEHL